MSLCQKNGKEKPDEVKAGVPENFCLILQAQSHSYPAPSLTKLISLDCVSELLCPLVAAWVSSGEPSRKSEEGKEEEMGQSIYSLGAPSTSPVAYSIWLSVLTGSAFPSPSRPRSGGSSTVLGLNACTSLHLPHFCK